MGDPAEWQNYLYLKKQEKGKKKFGFFLNYLEQEVPKNLGKLKDMKQGAAAARELKPEFKQAVDVFTPGNLGLKNSAIKDAFTNLMLAIQDLDTAVGAGKPE